MAFVGALISVILSAMAGLVVGAGATQLASGTRPVGALAALVACLVFPAVLDTKVTRAFRKLEPDARSTHFETLSWVNGAWLALLIVLFPAFTRAALDAHGTWWVVGGDRAAIRALLGKVAAHIPRSAAPVALADAPPAVLPPSAAQPQPAKVTPALAPDVGRPVIRAPENADDDDTPAARVYRERAASVVVIRTREAVRKDSPLAELFSGLGIEVREGLGSGFVVGADGVVATNHHVVGAATALDVSLQDGRHFTDVTVLRLDEQNDLALLQIPVKGLSPVPLATKDVKIGARAIAIGSPLGLEYTLTEGIVSARRTSEGTQFLQMQTSIAPGSSGGPLFNERGELIGVNTATQGANLNMAVHVSHVRALLAAPREPRALGPFQRGPEVRAVEAVDGAMDPTTRMNFRNTGEVLAHAAQRCVKDVPQAAHYTVYLTSGFLGLASRNETNLNDEAAGCLATSSKLVSLKIGFLVNQLRAGGSSARGVDILVNGIGPAAGELRFRFLPES